MPGAGKGLSTVCRSLEVVWRWGEGFRDESGLSLMYGETVWSQG